MTKLPTYTILLSIFTGILLPSNLAGQIRPPFKVLRFEENHSFLLDSTVHRSRLDRLKNISLGSANLLSVGGEVNQTFEYVRRPFADQIEDSYWLSRLMLHSDLQIGKRFRFFGEVASGTIRGRNGGPRVIDRDDLYLLNFFAEYRMGGFHARMGRQELTFGGENLLSIRNGTNVRYTFDAARFWWEGNKWKVDTYLGTFVNTNPGAFDNPILDRDGNIVWGVYATFRPSDKLPQIEPYYMGLRDPFAFYNQYIGSETRHSMGLRVQDQKGAFNYTFAGVYQIGTADSLDVNAFQLAAILSYQLEKIPVKVSVNGYLSSGDKDASDDRVNSFNPYFPQQASFRGAMATRVFPMNILFVGPKLEINKFPFLLTLDAGFLWRHRTTEGIFIPGGFPAYQATETSDNLLGIQYGLTAVQIVNRHLTFVWLYSHFSPRDYLLDQPNPGQVNDFFIGKMIFKF